MTPPSSKQPVVVITGGGTGIGLALAREWVSRQAMAIVIVSRTQATLNTAVAELETLAKSKSSPSVIKAIPADATVWAEIDSALEQTVTEFGSIEYIFANAGPVDNPQFDLNVVVEPSPDIHRVFDAHFWSTVNTVHAGAPRLAKSPAEDKAIIVTSSITSETICSLTPIYGLAKAALNGLVYNYGDHMPAGVRITGFAPGYTLTPYISMFAAACEAVKTVDDTAAEMMTHVDDRSKHAIVTFQRVDGALEDKLPVYPDRKDFRRAALPEMLTLIGQAMAAQRTARH
ncbi:hypothetical protein OC835_004249 [Tilletia horrida]|nr:hypothetical protein OC835_004249 [Tilletia horrida]